jgi:LEA14-like dessication related protein
MMRVTIAAAMVMASVPNCTDLYSVATHGLTSPVVTTDSSKVTAAADPAGVRVNIQFTATNPNDFPISLDSVDYQVFLDATQTSPVFTGTQEGLTVDEHSTEVVKVSGVVPTSVVTSMRFTHNQPVPFTVTGVAHVDSPAGVAVDFAFTATSAFVVP